MGTPQGKLVIFSAPSGSGKTTLMKDIMDKDLNLAFSISACTRAPRGQEQNGIDYYFLSLESFKAKIANNEFLEFEEVYQDNFYGTLRSEVERLWSEGKHVVFDIDVVGGLNLKKQYGDQALAVFIQAPSVEDLKQRLIARDTDSEEALKVRLAKAEEEMSYAPQFDSIIINDDLTKAKEETFKVVSAFLKS